jgi:protein gp37
MSANTAIEWTDATWTPIRARNRDSGKSGWFCVHKSEGCRYCYAAAMNRRLGTGLDFKAQNRDRIEIFLDEKMLRAPLDWKKPRMIFVCSMSDLFADFVPDEFIDRIFAVMALCPQHTFQILTKRPERMRKYLTVDRDMVIEGQIVELIGKDRAWNESPLGGCHGWPLPNVWLGASCEDQPTADERIPHLLATPAAIRFLSCEPMLGPIDLTGMCNGWYFLNSLTGLKYHDAPEGVHSATEKCARIDWIICGGESGPGARPMHPDWARALRDQCAATGVPFFFKQWGEYLHETQVAAELVSFEKVSRAHLHQWSDGTAAVRVGKKAAGRKLDGIEHNAFPVPHV